MYLNTGSTLPIRAIYKLYPKIFKAQDFDITSRNYSLILLSLANYFHYNIICSYFCKDNQSTHIKILLISKCSHLFWEVLLLDKSFFFFPPLMINTVFYKVKKKSVIPRASNAMKSKSLSSCAYIYKGENKGKSSPLT